MRMLNKCLFVAGTCAATFAIHGAEWLGTGGDTLWGNASNWQSSTGVPTGNIAISATAGDHRTVTLDGDHEFSGTFNVTTGTQEAPVVFNATAEAVAATNHVKQTSSNGFDVKSGGVLKIESGVYDWANDYRVSDNSILWMTGGRMTTKYWGVISGTAQIIMEGGELVSGWRDGAEQNNGRLNLNGGTSIVQTGGRIRCANNTNNGNDVEALTIGNTDGTTSVSVSGGEISASGKIHLGKVSGAVSTLSVSGTGVVSCSNDMRLGYGGANSTLTIAGDGQVNVGTTSTVRWLYFDTGTCAINLDGGTLQVGQIALSSTTHAQINFNGGTLKAETSSSTFLPDDESVKLNILEGGAVIDTDYGITISGPLVSGVENDGGLTKKGDGVLSLTGANTYTGDTVVERGVLVLPYSSTLNGNLIVKEKGTLVFDLTGYENLVENEEITLLTLADGKSLSFEADDDTLATSVFLIGPVVDATLAYDAASRTLKATLTSVTNASSTRKVTSWNGGADGLASPSDWHVDNDAHWSNGKPDGRYDVAVVSGDAKIFYYQGKWGDGGGRFGDLIIRHGTAYLCLSDGNPTFKSLHVGGVGTLKCSHVGLNPEANNLVIDRTVSYEASREASSSDTWVESSGGIVTFNGDVFVTNGYFRAYKNAVFNGNVLIADSISTHTLGETGNVTLNGTLTVGDEAKLTIGNLTLGEDARLVLKGTGHVANNANARFPIVVLQENSHKSYADAAAMATANGKILVDDAATLVMAPDAVSASASVVVASNATIVVDASGSTVSVSDSLTLAGVSLAENVNVGDITVTVAGLPYVWSASLDGEGRIVVTATDEATGPSRWIGGPSGYWKDSFNWTYGVPSSSLAAQVDTDSTIYFDANKTVSSLTVNSDVVFRSTDTGNVHPTVYIHEVDGTGKIGLYHVGFEGNGGDRRIGSASGNTLTIEFDILTTDSWLKNVSVYAPLTGSGYMRLYDGTKLYGDNSGFTGKVRKDDVDCRFMVPESGFPNASDIEIYGTLWLWFDEGTFYLGGNVSMRSSGNRGINMPVGAATSENGVTLVLGGGDGTVTLEEGYWDNKKWIGGSPYQFYTNESSWTPGCLNATVRKIGTGTMTCRITGAYNFSAEGGTTVFTLDNASANVSVAAGAVVSGNVCYPFCSTISVCSHLSWSYIKNPKPFLFLGDFSCPHLRLNLNSCAFAFLQVCIMNSTWGLIDLPVIPLLDIRLHEGRDGKWSSQSCAQPCSSHWWIFNSR